MVEIAGDGGSSGQFRNLFHSAGCGNDIPSQIGKVILQNTGPSFFKPVPEPSTWATMLTDFCQARLFGLAPDGTVEGGLSLIGQTVQSDRPKHLVRTG